MKKYLLLLTSLCIAPAIMAETVMLKDGSQIKGKIVQTTASTVYLESLNGTMAIEKTNIQTIDYSDIQKSEKKAEPEPESVQQQSSAPAAVPIAQENQKKRLVLFGSIDIYGPGGIDDVYKKDQEDSVAFLQSAGISGSGSVETTPGVGIRAGLIIPKSDDFEIGGSVGIIGGPEITETVNNGPFMILPSGPTFPYGGTTEIKVQPSYIRALLEVGKKIPLSKTVYFRLGGGIGAAAGTVEQTVTASGSAAAIIQNSEKTEHWSGLTWELAPSLIFPIGTAEMEAGFRYSQFPKKKGSDDISEIKWNPFSIFLGVRFGV